MENNFFLQELFPEMVTVKKTSSVKLDAVDSDGNSAVHHLVKSLEYGTFENTLILKVSTRKLMILI